VSEIDELETALAQEIGESDGKKGDCGCGSVASAATGPDEITDLVSLEANLSEALSEAALGEPSEDLLDELELLDDEVALAAELGDGMPASEPSVGLSELIELLEDHPGLKVTLSF